MPTEVSRGDGRVSTALKPKRRWAGKKTGKNPTDRGKLGVKRSVLTDGRGMPIGLAVAGANVHDRKLAEATLDSVPVPRPRPTRRRKQHLCGDKGYDADALRRAARRRGYTPHIRSRGEEQTQCRRGTRPRRWVVERIHSWMNRYRRILVRWEKKAANYIALLHLVFAHVLCRNS
jgi:putative transposase